MMRMKPSSIKAMELKSAIQSTIKKHSIADKNLTIQIKLVENVHFILFFDEFVSHNLPSRTRYEAYNKHGFTLEGFVIVSPLSARTWVTKADEKSSGPGESERESAIKPPLTQYVCWPSSSFAAETLVSSFSDRTARRFISTAYKSLQLYMWFEEIDLQFIPGCFCSCISYIKNNIWTALISLQYKMRKIYYLHKYFNTHLLAGVLNHCFGICKRAKLADEADIV